MPSDFERALYGLMNAGQGWMAGEERDKEYALKLGNQRLAERGVRADERRAKISEFENLGAPLADIETGLDQIADPARKRDDPVGNTGIRIGQAYRETPQISAANRFLEKVKGKSQHAPTSNPRLSAAVQEVRQLREKSVNGSLSVAERHRLADLERFTQSEIGFGTSELSDDELELQELEQEEESKKRPVKKGDWRSGVTDFVRSLSGQKKPAGGKLPGMRTY